MTLLLPAPAATRCRAKNPATCRTHGNPVTGATFEAEFKAQQRKAPVHKNDPAARAVRSDLTYGGPKPTWWEDYLTHLNTISDEPVDAELLDVIDTPAGPAAVVWTTNSEREQDQGLNKSSGLGMEACYYKHLATGETLGYVQVTYTSDASMKYSFGDDALAPFRWSDRYGRHSYGFRYKEREGGEWAGASYETKLRDVWVGAHKTNRESFTIPDGRLIEPRNLTTADAPDVKSMEKDLKRYGRQLTKDIKAHRAYYDTPYIDMARVHEPLLGKGFGSALYLYTARRLAKQNQVLRGSGLQSDEAQNTWARLARKLPRRVKEMELVYHDQPHTYTVLDFR